MRKGNYIIFVFIICCVLLQKNLYSQISISSLSSVVDSMDRQRKEDSIRKVRYLQYRIYFKNQISLYADSFSNLKQNMSFNILESNVTPFKWDPYLTQSLLVKIDKEFILIKSSTQDSTIIGGNLIKTKFNEFYNGTVRDTISNIYNFTFNNIFFYLIGILIFFYVLIYYIFKKFFIELYSFLPGIIFGFTKRFRYIPYKYFRKNLLFNFNYHLFLTIATFYHFYVFGFIKEVFSQVFYTLLYTYGFLILLYCIKYIWINIARVFMKYANYTMYKFYNFYFNKAIGVFFVPLLLVLFFLRDKSYQEYLLIGFDMMFFLVLIIKFFYLIKVAFTKLYNKKFMFIFLHGIEEILGIALWGFLWVVPQTHYWSIIFS